ncbi:hypothetical protein VTN02DRAFT_5201 [Thermoascus thermophilus]
MDMEMDAFTARNVRFAEVMKRGGRGLAVRTGENIVPFLIEGDGLREIPNTRPPSAPLEPEPVPVPAPAPTPTPTTIPAPVPAPVPEKQRKRKADEIADSEDDDDDADSVMGPSCLDDGWMEEEEERAEATYWAMQQEAFLMFDPFAEPEMY